MSRFIILFLTLAFQFSHLSSQEIDQKGTLVVSFKTGVKGERLDRIRFWLKNEKQDQEMFPKKGMYADDQLSLKRIVVIKDLTPGKYQIEFVVPNNDGFFEPVPSRDIVITEDSITEIEQVIKPRYALIQALACPVDSSLYLGVAPVISLKNTADELIKSSVDGELFSNQLLPGNYVLYFEESSGYDVPKPMQIVLGSSEQGGPYVGYYAASQTQGVGFDSFGSSLLIVPAGDSIVGDPVDKDPQNQRPAKTFFISSFSIAPYEVTNKEFAKWLTKEIREETIHVKKGLVYDKEDHLLFKTKESDIYSQILFEENDNLFRPISEKENYPVIDVTWYGADMYSVKNHYRLPTEAEWEKAAGTSRLDPKKKFMYGFSENFINPTYANYRSTDRSIKYFQVLTSEVGFYNGLNTLASGEKTHDAKSPHGAYDMSGNVWEWVSDWYEVGYAGDAKRDPKGPETGTKRVVKGGCYDSLDSGVRVAERMGLHPEHADPYTGFRVAR